MLKNVFGIIYTGEENMNLIELTARRAVGAFAGCRKIPRN